MKSYKIILAIAAAAIFGSGSLDAKSYKRGVSENNFGIVQQIDPFTPGVSWWYGWGVNPPSGVDNQVYDYTGLEFAPMCWSGNYDAEKIRTYCSAHPEVKYLLGFNEPNFTNQANMTPEAAAEKWPEVKALADELGLKLVAPALNYSPNPPYTDPTTWMDEFVALVGNDAFDFVAIHNYGGLGVMQELAARFHEKYGKPVWVTEFCYWPGEGDTAVAVETQKNSMIETVEWLETTDYIYRYAWFKAKGTSKQNYGLVDPSNGISDKDLTDLGYVYVYMSEFDKDKYYAPGETFSAVDYVASYGIGLDKGAKADALKPIEVSRFNTGATADYQFDVPADGNYNLVLTISGIGEPDRFDPQIGVCTVNDDDTDGELLYDSGVFSLPGDDAKYVEHRCYLNLKAGKQTLRLKDMRSGRPSGIRISSIRLVDAAGVENVAIEAAGDADALVDVYTATGALVRRGVETSIATRDLPSGLYIVGNRKVFVR